MNSLCNTLLRNTLLAAVVLVTGISAVQAEDVSMAAGSLHFSTPANWVGIMQTDGDPEVRVFQVPDPSPSAATTLARVTVTVKQVSDLEDFNAYVSGAVTKAKGMSDYQSSAKPTADNNSFVYSAKESGTTYAYIERYWFRNGHAIQLRCVRPEQSQAGQDWAASFDKGCNALAVTLNS